MHSRRIDLEREIFIRVPAFDSFIKEYSSNISTTGMFIRSEKPLASDTEITFEFRIADDWKLIQGKARVVWTRYRDEGPDQPAGMGVLFTELEPQGRRLIGWIIEKHVRDGGTPFELGVPGEMPAEFERQPEERRPETAPAPSTPPSTRPSEARHLRVDRPRRTAAPEPVRFRLGPLILAGLAVTLALAGLFWLSERGAQSIANPELELDEPEAAAAAEREAATDRPSGPAGAEAEPAAPAPSRAPAGAAGTADRPEARAATAPPATAPPSTPSTPVAQAPAATPIASPSAVSPVFAASVERLVDGWSRAWSEQDVDAYLAYYSRNFRPAGGESRSAWAAGRRQRLQAPEFIEISVDNLAAEVVSDSRGRVSFDQGYRSDTYQDSVRKVLELVREDGRWKILEEKSAG